MTYLDYMKNHPTENMDWCKPYISNVGKYALLMHDGIPEAIRTPAGDMHRYDGSLNDHTMREFAIAVNPNYDLYRGWEDWQIALDGLLEAGCTSCPWRDECEAMGETMGE